MTDDPMVTVRRVHMVACSLTSDDFGTEDYEEATAKAVRVEQFARRLGFSVMYEAVDHAD